MTKTFAERCHIAQQSLPEAQYKAMLTALHTEMLAKLAEQPAPVQYAEGLSYIFREAHRIYVRENNITWIEAIEEALAEQPAPAEGTLTEILNNPEVHYPGNFDTPARANALLTGLCQDAAIEIERLNKAVADEREACARVCESQPMRQDIDVREQCAAAIRARGNT